MWKTKTFRDIQKLQEPSSDGTAVRICTPSGTFWKERKGYHISLYSSTVPVTQAHSIWHGSLDHTWLSVNAHLAARRSWLSYTGILGLAMSLWQNYAALETRQRTDCKLPSTKAGRRSVLPKSEIMGIAFLFTQFQAGWGYRQVLTELDNKEDKVQIPRTIKGPRKGRGRER